MLKQIKKLHFIGIGGIGMSGIAEIFHNLGFPVSGSDLAESRITKRLASIGVTIHLGHAASNIGDAEVVVYSAAVPPTNPEIDAARARKLPLIPRAEMLNELTRLKTGIAISGTHGKTTTTSMVAEIFAEAGLDPTYVIGGKLNSINSNARLGKGEHIIFEACEAFGSFQYFSPINMVLLNIDSDHLEYYETMDSLRNAFLSFVNKIPFYGAAIVNNDDPNVRMILDRVSKRVVTYGLETESDYMAQDVRFHDWTSSFELLDRGRPVGRISLLLPGRHNVSNAVAAAAVALENGIPFEAVSRALGRFVNADRRFQIKGQYRGITVIDDYAHHPSEIRATLEGARQHQDKRVIAVFQPHLYSRTLQLYADFAGALALADQVVLLPVYPAREKPIPGVSSQLIVDAMHKAGYDGCILHEDTASLSRLLLERTRSQDLVIFLGAGSIWQYAEEFVELLAREDARYG